MIRNILLAMILALPCMAVAQTVDEEISLIQSLYGMEKRKLVSQYMQLQDPGAAGFWSVYEQYEAARKDLGRVRLGLINDYAMNYGSLTEEKADEMATKLLANNVAYEKLHQSYYKKFRKATSALKAAQFLQLETFLQNVIRSEIQTEIPFIGEIEKLRE